MVVKVGGSIIGEGVGHTILTDIKDIVRNDRLILVHGGGDEVSEIAERLGKKQTFIVSPEGIRSRYTDKETASIYTMV
ncbi:MAG: acetylaminoadipate kinase, partial [Nitrososphaerota archaeon]